jgi:uncharacterized protein DUF6339
MGVVYPRLRPDVADDLASRMKVRGLEDLRLDSHLTHPQIEYYPSGVKVDDRRMAKVRDSVRDVVDNLRFPAPHRGNVRLINLFDHEVGRRLHRDMNIVPADAAADGVWSFMSLVVLPDVAMWRFPEFNLERLLGGPRNVLRRLWWRAFVLGDGPHDAPAQLGEDQLVQVMERPTLGGNPRIARAFCSSYLSHQASRPDVSPMFWMRDAAKRLIRLTAFVALDALDDNRLDELMDEVVVAAAGSFPGPRQREGPS